MVNWIRNDTKTEFHMWSPIGLKSEGLYRVAGRKDDCLTLQAKVDEGRPLVQSSRY